MIFAIRGYIPNLLRSFADIIPPKRFTEKIFDFHQKNQKKKSLKIVQNIRVLKYIFFNLKKS